MSGKRVLLICYYFPPLGGAGVGRPLALFKYLPRYGYECDVLTVKPVAYRGYEPELLDGLETRRIYRAGSWDPQRLLHFFGARKIKDATISGGKKISGRFFPDPKVGWVRSATRLGRTLATNRHYNAIISTSPPISTHLVGRKLAQEFRLPWVADFRDYWTGYKAEDWFDNERSIRRAKKLLSRISSEASSISVVNPAIAEYLGQGQVIYNSFDPERASLWRPPKRSGKFVIGILGTLDELRPIEPLLKLLAGVRERSPEAFEKIRLAQVGQVNIEGFESLLDQYRMRNRIDLHGTRNRQETIELLSDSSMLYIGLSTSKAQDLVPGRLFDMLASGRSLLAYVPADSMIAALLNETGNGCCYHVDDTDRAEEYVLSRYQLFTQDELKIDTLREYAEKYSAEQMAAQFAGLFESLRAPK